MAYTLRHIQDATANISQLSLPLQVDDLILFIRNKRGEFRAVYEDLSITKITDETLTVQWMSNEQTLTAVVVNPQNPLASLSIQYETFILVTGRALESLHKSTRTREKIAA